MLRPWETRCCKFPPRCTPPRPPPPGRTSSGAILREGSYVQPALLKLMKSIHQAILRCLTWHWQVNPECVDNMMLQIGLL